MALAERATTRVIALLATLVLALALVALASAQGSAELGPVVAAGHEDQSDDHGPPGDPPCEQGEAGEHNPNCDPEEDPNGNGNGEPPEPAAFCPPPDGEFELEVPAAPLLYACLVLGPDEDSTPEEACPPPGGALEVEVPAGPLAYACVVVAPDEEDEGNGNEAAAAAASTTMSGEANRADPDDHGPPNDPPCEQGDAGEHNPNCEAEEPDNDEPNGERCESPDGLDLGDNGTIGQQLHDNDPTGLSNDPDASGPVSEPLYDETQDTPIEPLGEEGACAANLATL